MATGNPIIVEEDIYDLLEEEGYLDDWEAKIGVMPDENDDTYDNVICINSFGGIGVDTNQYQRPNFQIIVRSEPRDYLKGRKKAQNILDFLMNFEECTQYSFTINGHYYSLIFPLQTAPEHLGFDKRNRALFSFNFNAFAETSDNVLLDGLGEVVFDGLGDVIYDGLAEAKDG